MRTDSCPTCYSDVKVCLNCSFYDPGLNNQCREPQAEWQTEKARANFCEFFELRRAGGSPGAPSPRSARSAFDDLFKKK